MSLHIWRPQGPCKPSSYATFMLNSQSLAPTHPGSLRLCPTLCNPEDHGLPGFSGRGFLQARILEFVGQQLVDIPFWSIIFPAALAINSSEYQVLTEPL